MALVSGAASLTHGVSAASGYEQTAECREAREPWEPTTQWQEAER